MKPISIIVIILTVGVFIFLKIFQDSIPKINEPITNIFVFVGFVIFAVIYGISRNRKK
ncbi:hypothetical protein SAMN04487969_113176 [Paenibacillus algorifonticola]|uniref:Uncharacterized protein n=1 Tax=Paenibacillus algorifonticola TaxID=684063 RepID=A0A1I2FWP0_9BACL|nr:hypothetical protein SAMN04487969_113176 [Paenibacillus algorifonticola]